MKRHPQPPLALLLVGAQEGAFELARHRVACAAAKAAGQKLAADLKERPLEQPMT